MNTDDRDDLDGHEQRVPNASRAARHRLQHHRGDVDDDAATIRHDVDAAGARRSSTAAPARGSRSRSWRRRATRVCAAGGWRHPAAVMPPPSAASMAASAASRLGAVGAAGLRHVAAGRRRPCRRAARSRRRTRSTALNRPVRSSVTPTTTPALPSSADADDRDDAGAELLLALVGQALEVLHVDAR